MESLKNYTLKAKEITKKALVTWWLLWALTLSTASCWETTPQDVNQQKQKVEMIGHQLRSYINSRKYAVEKYNNLLKYPQTESNRYSMEKIKSDLYDTILSYDEKIESLASKKLKAEKKVSEKMSECLDYNLNPGPLDPNKYDYLLEF